VGNTVLLLMDICVRGIAIPIQAGETLSVPAR